MNPQAWARSGAQKKRKRTKSTRKQKRILFGGHKYRPCAYCGKDLILKKATLDHVKAFSRGGYERLENAAIACGPCNWAKGSMTREQFINWRAAGCPRPPRKPKPTGCEAGQHRWQLFAGYRYCERCLKDELIEHIDL